jgi:hypothetical protein
MMSLWGNSASPRRETHEGLAQVRSLFHSIHLTCLSFGCLFVSCSTVLHRMAIGFYTSQRSQTPHKRSPFFSLSDSSYILEEQLLKSSARGSTGCLGLPAGPVFLPPNALIQYASLVPPATRTHFSSALVELLIRRELTCSKLQLFEELGHYSRHRSLLLLSSYDSSPLLSIILIMLPLVRMLVMYGPLTGQVNASLLSVNSSRCDIPPGRTFLVNEKGEVHRVDLPHSLHLLQVTTMTTVSTKRSFTEMNSLLHQLFPVFHGLALLPHNVTHL